jgi:type II secretory pathway pseudopilin PulG
MGYSIYNVLNINPVSRINISSTGLGKGLTLVEMIIALSLMTIVFASVVPLFSQMSDSWDSKQAAAEILQNGRILMEHIQRNLSKAVRIISVSDSSETDGFIEFENNNSETFRYDISISNNNVEFGQPGNLSELAGPVSSLRFTCYDACDLDTPMSPVTDTNSIRVIKIEATLTNQLSSQQDKALSTWIYLRTNSQSGGIWEHTDIGDVGTTGSANCAEGTWTIRASGDDIWNNTDEFHYVYQSLSGDGQIIARVVSIEYTNSWAKAGVMIRETLNGNSKHAMMVVTPGNGTAFQYRTSTGAGSNHTAGSYITAPYWVKLIRSGNTFTGYESADGSIWTEVGSVSITMTTDIYIGLAVTSHNDGTLCTAVIDNVGFNTVTYETFSESKLSSGGTSITIPTPATNAGDLLIAAVATDGDTSLSLVPPGGKNWTEIDIDDYSNDVTLGVWWKQAEASESPSHQFSWSGNELAYGWMMRFTGQNPSVPINTWSDYGEYSSTPTSPAVTSTANNSLILRLGAFNGDDIVEDAPGLPGHVVITMDKSTNVIFQDGFETDFSKWTDGGSTDWSRSSVDVYSGNNSAWAGQNSNDLISDNINTSGYSSFSIEFWYRVDDIDDNDDVYLQLYNGSSYVNYFEIGTAEEDTWLFYETTITNSQYRRANFRIKFEGSSIDNNENLWIDDVKVSANGVSGGAGYIKQASTGSSGTSTFSLVSSNEAKTLTIAIAPENDSVDGYGIVRP